MTRRPTRLQRWLARRHDRSGMSLVELMISLIVMSIGILGVAALFPIGRKSSNDDRLLTQAVDLGQQQMEQLRALTFVDPALTAGWHPDINGEQLGPSNRFNRRYQVLDLTGDLAGTKQVEIQVTWADISPDTVRLVTYIGR